MTSSTNPTTKVFSGNVRVFNITFQEVAILKEQLDLFKKSAIESKLELHAKISLLIYKNQSQIDKKYFEYEKLRQQVLINNFERDEDEKPIIDEETKNPKFKNEELLNEELVKLLSTETEIHFVTPDMKSVERKIETLKAEEFILEQLWYLLDVFENLKRDE